MIEGSHLHHVAEEAISLEERAAAGPAPVAVGRSDRVAELEARVAELEERLTALESLLS